MPYWATRPFHCSPLGKIERGDSIQQIRLDFAQPDGLAAQPLLEQPAAAAQPIVSFIAGDQEIGRCGAQEIEIIRILPKQRTTHVIDDSLIVKHARPRYRLLSSRAICHLPNLVRHHAH